jgi:hypothetical protein
MLRNIIGLVVVLAIGGGLVYLGVFSYFDLAEWEELGARRRMHWAFALLYNTFGKWGPAAAFIGVGWVLVCYTLYRFIYHRNDGAAQPASQG